MTGGNGKGDAANRVPITISVMLATFMSSLDSTIANVALPHIQGSVSASADQITWVLTSYIVAAAIMTPLTGFLSGKFGRKIVLLICVAGFTGASMLCGIADSLVEIVAFRLLQGVFGAALIPMSQAVLLDINPPERHGQAMAIWGAGAVVGPILGPALGGWLTEHLSWRWVFFINLPVGIVALIGLVVFLSEKRAEIQKRLDVLGFAALAVAVGAFQLLLDRGPSQDWFGSPEIWTYLVVAGIALWVFCVQIATAKRPFVSRDILANRNFVVASLIGFLLGVLVYASMALLPTLMQNVMGYPVAFAGLVSMPRGFGSFLTMFTVGFLLGRVPLKAILLTGMVFSALSLFLMTRFSLGMDTRLLIVSGFVQGLGTGFLFVLLSTIGFSTIAPEHRGEAAGFFTFIRNVGASVGISIMQARLVTGVETHHAVLVEQARPDNPLYQAYLAPPYSFDTTAGLSALNAMLTRQATMLSYIDDFRLMLILTIVCAPMILLMRAPKTQTEAPHVHVD